jgi:hypothetical protein
VSIARTSRPRLTGSPLGSRVAQWGARGLIRNIQSGTIALAGVTSNTATITTVNTGTTLLFNTGNSISAGGSGDGFCRLVLTNSTTITATRTAATGTATVAYFVIEFVPGAFKSLQNTTITIADTATSNTATITAVDTTKTFINSLGSDVGDNASGSSTNWLARLVLTNSTTVTATRSGTSGQNILSFQVVEMY